MDRREAILRELNLYPQWVLRSPPAHLAGDPLPAETGVELVPPVAAEVSMPDAVLPVGSETIADRRSSDADTSSSKPVSVLDVLNWTELKQRVHDCNECKLRAGCTQTVFGVGDENADWLFVGEGPGADEDALGEPFVGQAGKLLDNMLLAINLKRGKNVYIANVVKCRPPSNRTPQADEISQCLPYLQRQIELIKPRIIVVLGKTAATALLGQDVTLGSLRGKLHDYQGVPVIVTYHPAYLLRSPTEKYKAWQDLLMAAGKMQEK